MMARPDLLDRAALLHPLVPWDLAPAPTLEGTRVLVTAGRNDPIGPLPLTERLLAWVQAQGADVTFEIHGGGHELRQTEVIALRDFFAGAFTETREFAPAMRGS